MCLVGTWKVSAWVECNISAQRGVAAQLAEVNVALHDAQEEGVANFTSNWNSTSRQRNHSAHTALTFSTESMEVLERNDGKRHAVQVRGRGNDTCGNITRGLSGNTKGNLAFLLEQ